LSSPHRLEIVEYVCWVSSAVGAVVAALSEQVFYAAAPLCFSTLLNLANRRRLDLLIRRQTMTAIARVHQQLTQDIYFLYQQVQSIPASSNPPAATPPSLAPTGLAIAESNLPTFSPSRLNQLEELQLIYHEILQLQEQYHNLRDSLVSVIDYLDRSALPTKVNALEDNVVQLYDRLMALQTYIGLEDTLQQTAIPTIAMPQPGITQPAIAQSTDPEIYCDSVEEAPVSAEAFSAYPALTLPQFVATPPEPPIAEAVPHSPSFTLTANAVATVSDVPAVAAPTVAAPAVATPAVEVSATPAPHVTLPNVNGSAPLQTWQRTATLSNHADWVSGLAIAPDGKTLISSSFDKTIQLWNLGTRESLAVLSEHTSPVCAIALTSDGRFLASGSWDKTIKLWQLDKPKPIATLTNEGETGGSVRSLAISPDGQMLASGWFDQTVKLWKLKSEKRKSIASTFLGSYGGHLGRVDAIAFSPDSQTFASGSADGTVKTWQLNTTGKPLHDLTRVLVEASNPVTSLAFSPDGTLLASGSRDQTIQLWNVASGERVQTLSGHSGAVMSVVFLPDGDTLASGSTDGTVRLWHVRSGQVIAMLPGEIGTILSVSLSADGHTLACGSAEGAIEVWQRI
jgi:WD40 repeat protein